jgi:phytoene/squalene synthetase
MLPELNAKEKLRKVKRQKKVNSVTEAIASKDYNNLYISSSFFKDRMKYKAFCAFYAVMRIVDDRIDNLPLSTKQNEETLKKELVVVDSWEQVVISCQQGIYPISTQLESCNFTETSEVCESLIESFRNFYVPIELWTNFFDAMRSDLVAGEFKCWSGFLEYAEGATVAPTTIYLLLIVSRLSKSKNSYEIPIEFDLFTCGRYLGIFAYLAHIIRDLVKDIKAESTRICITDEDMAIHGLSIDQIKRDVIKHHATPQTRNLVKDLLLRAKNYHAKGSALAEGIKDFIESDCQFILELIIKIYEHIILKIESQDFDPMLNRHYLSKREKVLIIKSVAYQTGFPLPNWIGI